MKEILDLLKVSTHYNYSEVIEVAKGKHELPTTVKGAIIKAKRIYKWKQK
jgi:hypothetical protein